MDISNQGCPRDGPEEGVAAGSPSNLVGGLDVTPCVFLTTRLWNTRLILKLHPSSETWGWLRLVLGGVKDCECDLREIP